MNERIGFGLYQSRGNRGSVGRVSVFWLLWCGWHRWGVSRELGPESGGVGWCYVCVSLDSLCRWQVQVSVYCVCGYLRICGAQSVQSCCTLWISAS